jgi:hypothetical protein
LPANFIPLSLSPNDFQSLFPIPIKQIPPQSNPMVSPDKSIQTVSLPHGPLPSHVPNNPTVYPGQPPRILPPAVPPPSHILPNNPMVYPGCPTPLFSLPPSLPPANIPVTYLGQPPPPTGPFYTNEKGNYPIPNITFPSNYWNETQPILTDTNPPIPSYDPVKSTNPVASGILPMPEIPPPPPYSP